MKQNIFNRFPVMGILGAVLGLLFVASVILYIAGIHFVVFLAVIAAVIAVNIFFTLRVLKSRDESQAAAEKLGLIFNNMPMAANISGRDSAIIECNDEAPRLYGLSCKEEYKKKFPLLQPFFQPDGRPSMEKALEMDKIAFANGHNRFEWLHQTLSGEAIPCEVTLVKIIWSGEEQILSFVRDLRKAKAAIEVERELGRRIQMMFDAAPLLVESWNKDCTLIECNKTTLDFYGYSAKEGYQENLKASRLENQPDGTNSWDKWSNFIKRTFEIGYNNMEYVDMSARGETAYLDIIGVRVQSRDREIVITYSNEFTQLKETLARMLEAEERSKAMLDGTPVACYLINKDFKAIDCNNEILSLFGFSNKPDGLINMRAVFANDNQDELKAHFVKALQYGNHRFEWDLINPGSNELISCDISFVRFQLQKESVIAAYLFDQRLLKQMIREKELAAIAEENSKAKSNFLAKMSHEIRTPISAVLGISEIQLQSADLTPHVEEAFAKIHDSSSILLSIVNDILDLSKIEAGKMSLIMEEYGTVSLINDILQLHYVYFDNNRVKFEMRVDENLPTIMVGDTLRIKQVINNVLSNAFKYTAHGKVEFLLSCKPIKDDENRVNFVMAVNDTGMGMSGEQLQSLFDDYSRFHEIEARFAAGTGLGMTIVYGLLQMMNGSIDVKSEVGKGTRVTITLPQEIVNSNKLGKETAEKMERFEVDVNSAAKKFRFVPEHMPYGKVLVVDDVDTNLFVARGLLMFYGLTVETCVSGYEALEKVKNDNVYDIIFMDHMMPGMCGSETTKNLRKMGYTSPIVALTANALIGQAEEFLNNGFDGFISKPIQTKHLNSILLKYIKDKQPPEVIAAALEANRDSPGLPGNIDEYLSRSDVLDELHGRFVKDHTGTALEMQKHLGDGDFATAHRLAHSLKGAAGLINKKELAELAQDMETTLSRHEKPDDTHFGKLGAELSRIITQISANLPEQTQKALSPISSEEILALFESLQELLSSRSADSLELIDELSRIPGSETLSEHIKSFEFREALASLQDLKNTVSV